MNSLTQASATAALVLLLGGSRVAAAQSSGTATTTRYWDCCKPSAAWPGKAAVGTPVSTCAANGVTKVAPNVASGCDGGTAASTAFTCNNAQPWTVNLTLSYGYAAANIVGQSEAQNACACYALQFTSGPVSGKTMVVQVIGAGADQASSNFGLLIPGGGVGVFSQGCTAQWGTPSSGWGAQYGGVSSASDCAKLPSALQPGCNWRFGWFGNANNPGAQFKRVKCPTAITANTGCVRADDSSQPSLPPR